MVGRVVSPGAVPTHRGAGAAPGRTVTKLPAPSALDGVGDRGLEDPGRDAVAFQEGAGRGELPRDLSGTRDEEGGTGAREGGWIGQPPRCGGVERGRVEAVLCDDSEGDAPRI